MADNNDDLFGGGNQKTEQNDVEVEDIENDNHYDDGQDEVNEEDQHKLKEQRRKKKEAFVKKYLQEKEWFKEDQRRAEELKRKEQERIKKRMQQFTNSDQLSILEKYEKQDKEDELFKPITKYKGPTSERVFTNKHCIYLWIGLNAFFVFTAIYVLNDGRPTRLSNGYDFRSEICGYGNYVGKPYLYYANPVQDIRVGFCIDKCPDASGPLICLYDKTGTNYDSQYTKFCYIQMQGVIRSKYCVPNEPKNQQVVQAHLESFDYTVKRYASDVNMSFDVIGGGVVLTVLLSFIFTNLLRKDSTLTCFVFTIFFLTTLCFSALAFLFFREYLTELELNCFTQRDEKDCVGSRGYSYRALAIVVLVFGGIYVLVLMIMSKRLIKIIGFLKIASQVVEILTQIKWLPFYILMVAAFIATITLINVPFGLSVADVKTVDSVDGAISGGKLKIMEFSGFAYFIALYDFFIFIVWMLFLLGFRDLFISYSICLWFFTKRKDTVLIPKWVIFKNILKYHVGTIVMYSLISTCVTFPKMMIMTIRKSLRNLPQYLNCVRYFQATCNCCLFSYEKFLRYFSKHSLVQVSITSKDFYPCSKIAYFLIFRNKDKISDMDMMQEFIVSNIKFCAAFISGLFVYAILSFIDQTPFTHNNTNEIENKIIPGIVMFIFSYFFSAIFLGSYDITCKSVIQCYLIDQEIFFGEKRYVEPFIKNVFEYYVKEDLEKYKFQSKAGVVLDADKAKKIEEVSDDDKSFQSEEEDSEQSQEDLRVKQQKKKTTLVNGNNTVASRDITQTNKVTTEASISRPMYNPSQIYNPSQNVLTNNSNANTPSRLITADKGSTKPIIKEQELVRLDQSDDDDNGLAQPVPANKFQNTSMLSQTNQRLNTNQSAQSTPTILSQTKYGPKVINVSDGISPNNNSRFNLEMSNSPGSNNKLNQSSQQLTSQSQFFKGRENTVTIQKPSQYSTPSNTNLQTIPNYTQPIQTNPSITNLPFQNNSMTQMNLINQKNQMNQMNQMNQRNYQQQPPPPQQKQYNVKQNNPIFANQLDEDDDDNDDFGLAQNPYASVKQTQNIDLSRGPNRNDMRLLNASYQSGVRGLTGQSNASKVSKVSKASFDPFVQFEKNQINADSDDDDDDND